MGEKLKEYTAVACREVGVEVGEDRLDRLCRYADLLVERNRVMNLTGITDDEGIAVRHFADSLSVLKFFPTDESFSLIDVGTGAGFPGLPIAIMRDNADVTLLDSLNKRINFLKEAAEKADTKVSAVHARAEDAGHDADFRERYDFAVARAVANLPTLCELCLPFVKVGGKFIAMKAQAEDEIAETQRIIGQLSAKIENICSFNLFDGSERTIIIFQKTAQMPTKFPRPAAKIAKKPLK